MALEHLLQFYYLKGLDNSIEGLRRSCIEGFILGSPAAPLFSDPHRSVMWQCPPIGIRDPQATIFLARDASALCNAAAVQGFIFHISGFPDSATFSFRNCLSKRAADALTYLDYPHQMVHSRWSLGQVNLSFWCD